MKHAARNAVRTALYALASLAVVLLIASAGMVNAAQASEVTKFAEDRYFVDVADVTNQRVLEQWRHASEKARAAEVAGAIAGFKEAERIASEAAESASEAVYDYGYDYGTTSYGYGGTAAYSADPDSLQWQGVQSDGTYTYTWYSQRILPGNGLSIPGRHVGDGGYVMDGDGNIVVASSDLAKGTKVDTPYGSAVVYDTGCASGVLDVYTNW